MTTPEILIENVIKYLKSFDTLKNETIIASFDKDTKPIAVDDGVVIMGIGKFSVLGKVRIVGPDGLTIFTSDRNATAQLSVRIYVPYSSGCKRGYELFDKVMSILLNASDEYTASGAQCSEPEYQEDMEALLINSTVTLNMVVKN